MTVATELSGEAIAAVDTSGLLADVLDLPEQLRDALWRVESADLEEHEATGGLIVAGMGGSAIGGALAAAVFGDRASRPIVVSRDYDLPPGATPEATVLCASYSGNTEETLAQYDAAGALGARRIVVTTGGRLAELARDEGVPVIPMPGVLQPRAAVAYLTVAALEVSSLCGAAPRVHSEIDVAAAHLAELAAEWGPHAPEDALPKELARGLHGRVGVFVGAGLTAPVAYRWRTQVNENAKLPAFSAELPEADHNDIAGWDGSAGLGPLAAVFLADCDQHPRKRRRIDLTKQLIGATGADTFLVESRGETRTERVFSLVLLGDLVSIYLAALRGVDPTPVEAIERLKEQLAAGE